MYSPRAVALDSAGERETFALSMRPLTFLSWRFKTVDVRWGLSLLLCASLIAAVVAGVLALDPLFIHGFAPACSDGYAEANGTPPCMPQWSDAAPYLLALCIALAGVVLSAAKLARSGDSRRAAHSTLVS